MSKELTPEQVEAICRAMHEANRAYCIAGGDNSQPTWENAPDWAKESSLKALNRVKSGNTSPSASHEKWMQDKIDEGWRWGPVRSNADKIHPDMVPYEQLSAYTKGKDYVIVGVAQAMLRAYGVE